MATGSSSQGSSKRPAAVKASDKPSRPPLRSKQSAKKIPISPPAASQPPVQTNSGTPVATSLRLSQSLDILEKQYRLYSWNDSKALSLITTNSLLFAAIGFLFTPCLPDMLALILLGLALVAISLSLMVVLRQVIPQGSSGRSGEAPNVRSLRGICSFQDWESYRSFFCGYSEEQFAEDAIRQAYGMAINNDKSRAIIRRSVVLTLAGIVLLIAAAVAASLSARGLHAMGSWAAAPSQAQQPLTAKGLGNTAKPTPPSKTQKTDTQSVDPRSTMKR